MILNDIQKVNDNDETQNKLNTIQKRFINTHEKDSEIKQIMDDDNNNNLVRNDNADNQKKDFNIKDDNFDKKDLKKLDSNSQNENLKQKISNNDQKSNDQKTTIIDQKQNIDNKPLNLDNPNQDNNDNKPKGSIEDINGK